MKWTTTLVLVIIVIVYAIVGAIIFKYLEADNEQTTRELFYESIYKFIGDNSCVNISDIVDVYKLLDSMPTAAVSFNDNGTDLVTGTRWDYYTSIFVAVELVGTIGYYLAAPKTTGGRIFTVFFAFIGIPLFLLSVIALGQLLNFGAALLLRLFVRCRYGRQERFGVRKLDVILGRRSHRVYRATIICVLGFVLFVLIPSVIFTAIEGWSYGTAVYYCFTTLFTIGFGDYIPGYGQYPSGFAIGWYRLAVASWLLIIVGWFACAVAAVKSLTMSVVQQAIEKAEQSDDDDVSPQKTKYAVDQIGPTSVVNVTRSNKKSQRFWKRPSGKAGQQSAGDITAVSVRPRDPSRNSDAFPHTSVIDSGQYLRVLPMNGLYSPAKERQNFPGQRLF